MKHLIILLLFSLQLKAQILVPTDRTADLITSSIDQLGDLMFKGPQFMQPVVYIDYAPLDVQVLGLTRELTPGYYMIDLNPRYSWHKLEKVLLHELVHVAQFHSGRLQTRENHFQFDNVAYPFSYPYSERPWELEAIKVSEAICE